MGQNRPKSNPFSIGKVEDLHGQVACAAPMYGHAPLALHRVHDGNLGFLRLGCLYPPVSPTSGIPYAGSNHSDRSLHQSPNASLSVWHLTRL